MNDEMTIFGRDQAGFISLSVYLDMNYQTERLWRTCVMNFHATLNCIPLAQHWRLRQFFDLSMTWAFHDPKHEEYIAFGNLQQLFVYFISYLFRFMMNASHTPDYRNE